MKKNTFLILFSFFCCNIFAQQATTASGGNASGSGGSVSYSVGQIVYTTNSGTNGSSAQGVQQPYEISVVAGFTEAGVDLNFSAYPNPTNGSFTLKVEKCDNQMIYQLFDISGKLLDGKQITEKNTFISMQNYAKSIYFLKVIQNDKEIKTFKIILN